MCTGGLIKRLCSITLLFIHVHIFGIRGGITKFSAKPTSPHFYFEVHFVLRHVKQPASSVVVVEG